MTKPKGPLSRMPTPPRGLGLDELVAWQRDVGRPWRRRAADRIATWVNNVHVAPRQHRVVEERTVFVADLERQVVEVLATPVVDRGLDEVDPLELLLAPYEEETAG